MVELRQLPGSRGGLPVGDVEEALAFYGGLFEFTLRGLHLDPRRLTSIGWIAANSALRDR
jgi:hypothetical protein